MRTIAGSLIWKEFREQWGDVLATIVVTLAIPVVFLLRDLTSTLSSIEVTLGFYPFLAGVFFGMRAAAGERSRQTAAFLFALPVEPRRLGAAKCAATAIAVLLPMWLTIALGLGLARFVDQSGMSAQYGWALFLIVSLGTLVITLAVAVFGAGARSEVLAAVRGLVAIVLLWIALSVASALVVRYLLTSSQRVQAEHWAPFAVQLAVMAAILAIAFVAGYRRTLVPLAERSMPGGELRCWSPHRLSSPLAAILWKDAAVMSGWSARVLFLSCAISLLLVGVRLFLGERGESLQTLSYVLWGGGFILALLSGVGSLATEIEPQVNAFWRSRPISATMWYWSKFGMGLVTIVVSIALPMGLALSVAGTPDPTGRGLAWSLLLWVVVFSFSVTLTYLIRQPVRAGILAVGCTALLYVAVQSCYGSLAPWDAGAPLQILVPVFATALVASAVGGWWIAARDFAAAV
jgi:ABC-type transport system involved in multi-copper enzyme maturation permease subunit